MGRIDKVKIGGIVFDVVRVHELKHPTDNRRLDGHIIYGKCKIDLDDDMAPQAELQTIWHEIIHGILVQAGCSETADKEDVVDAMAYGIMAVLYDNPQLGNVKP